MAKQKLVMIGNGVAGIRTIGEILERVGGLYDITVINKEPYPNYNRIILSNILQNKMTVEETIMSPYERHGEHDIKLITNDLVVDVDRANQNVTTANGIEVAYNKLVFTMKSKAFVIPVPGSALPSVIGWGTIDDTERMMNIAKAKKEAIVIGEGLLGLKCTRGLLDQGVEVTVSHLAERLMEMQLDRKAGDMLKTDPEKQGMKFEMQANTAEISGEDDVEGVKLTDRCEIPTDLVVMAVGIRPYTKVTKESGLGINCGIVVNDVMQTSDSNVYTVGECAEHNGKIYGLVAPLYEQGKVLVSHLTNKEANRYKGSATFTSLKVSGCDLYSAGQIVENAEIKDIEIFNSADNNYRKIFLEDGNVVGAVLYGDIDDGSRSYNMMKKGESTKGYTLVSLLTKDGEEASLSIADMADDEAICGYNGVDKGTIVDAITENGFTTVEEVTTKTRAGNSCSRCKPQTTQILQHTLGDDFVAAKPASICGCTNLTHDQIVTQIRARGLKTSKEVRHALNFKNKGGCPKCRPAINYYLNMIYPHDHEDERESRFANGRYRANIQDDGTFSVMPQMRGGITGAGQLIRLREVAKEYHVLLVRVTGSQHVGLYGAKKEELPNIWENLGMCSASTCNKKTRSVKSCADKEFCRFGTQYTIRLDIHLEKTFEYIDTPHKFKVGVPGCPKSCVELGVKDSDIISIGDEFQIYIGGNGGTEVEKAEFLTTVETEDGVIKLCSALMQYYHEIGIYAERTTPWLRRLGFENVKEVLLDPERQNELSERIMDAKKVAEAEPWEAATSNAQA